MKKIVCLFCLIFIISNTQAQYKDWTEAKVYLKGGEVLEGRARLPMLEQKYSELAFTQSSKEYLRFLQGKQRKSTKFEGKDVDSVVFSLKRSQVKKSATYVPILKNKKRERYGLAELLIDGKVKFVKRTVSNTGFGNTFKESLLLREGEEAVIFNYAGLGLNPFKKRASEYFNDCPDLVSKINDKKYRRKDLEALVRFYNSNCAK